MIASTRFNREDVTMIGDDIRYIRRQSPQWRQKGQQSIPIWVWSTYVIAVALFVFPGIFSKMNDNRISTADIRKSKGALKLAMKDLSKSQEDIFAHTSMIIYRYFQSKLFLSSENLDPLALEIALEGLVSPESIEEIVTVTQLCDAGRFGPHASESEDALQSQVGDILKKIDEALA